MTDKEFVKSIYPNAKCIKYYSNMHIIFPDKMFVYNGLYDISFGETENLAWENARLYIEQNFMEKLNDR